MPRAERARLTFYTSNPGKVAEVRVALRPHGWAVRWGRRQLTEPQAETLEVVARAKIAQVPRGEGAVMVEDAGLFIPALGGFPGVYSAYAYRTLGVEGVLRLLAGRRREATFRAVVAFRNGDRVRLFSGEVEGSISPAARGAGGFGFDPVFVPRGERRTFSEMTPQEKLAWSHRGRAVSRLAEHLRTKNR